VRFSTMTMTLLAGVAMIGAAMSGVAEPVPVPAPAGPATTAPAARAPALSAADAAAIAALVGKLGDDDYQTRQSAMEELVKFGEDARPALQRAAKAGADEEARSRAESALRLLDDANQSGPTLVTVHLKDVPAKTIFDELFRQARAPYGTHPPQLFGQQPGPTLTVDVDRQPFLSVLKDVCAKGGYNVRHVYDSQKMTIIQEGAMAPMHGPGLVQGPILVTAGTIQTSSYMQLGGPGAQSNKNCNLGFSLLLEPKVRLMAGSFRPEKVEDDQGKSMIMEGAGMHQINRESPFAWSGSVQLQYPGRAATRIKTFRANLQLIVQTQTEVVEIGDILNVKNLERQVGTKRFLIKSVRKDGEGYRIEMTMFPSPMSAEEWQQFSYPYGRIQLLDAEDRPLSPSSGGGGGGNNGEGANFYKVFQRSNHGEPDKAPGEPAKFRWELPLKTREVVIPIELNDIPLP